MQPDEPSTPLETAVSPGFLRFDMFGRVARSAVAWSFVATGLRFGSAVFLLPLILRSVPREELGLWYVFLALGSFASLLDFGFAPTVIRSAGYLWAGARNLLPFGVEVHAKEEAEAAQREPNRALLADLVASVRVYYLAIALFVLMLLLGVGGAWIWTKTTPLESRNWLRAAFAVYAIGVALNFANSLWPYLLSAINAVRRSQQIFAFSLLAFYLIAAAGLLLGGKLWALVIGIVIMGVMERSLGRRAFLRISNLQRGAFDARLLGILWPNAWRAGSVAVSGFLVAQANTIVCSAFLDLSTTASYGLSLQAILLLYSVSSVWINVKLPLINQLRASGDCRQIAAIVRARVLLCLATYIAGATVLICFGPMFLALVGTRTPLLGAPLLMVFAIIYLLDVHHSAYAGLVHSENMNPFVKPWLVSGVATISLSLILTPRFGVWALLFSQGFVQLCFNNWWTVVRAIRGLGMGQKEYWRGFSEVFDKRFASR